MPAVIGRIVLPKTTSLSLNDRFSHLRQLREQQLQYQQQLRARPQLLASSLENQRLVEQMEKRPTVRAALAGPRAKKMSAAAVAAATAAAVPRKRLHVKQRLAVQARLGVVLSPAGRGATVAGRGLAGRLGRIRPLVKRLQPARVSTRLQWGPRTASGRGLSRSWSRGAGRPSTHSRGGGGGWRSRGGVRGRGRGRGRGGSQRPRLTREQLDQQLDEYMNTTRSHLDAELDAYMRETDL